MKPRRLGIPEPQKEADGCKALACAVLEQAYRDHHRGYNLTNFMKGGEDSMLEFWCQVAEVDQDWFREMVYKSTRKTRVYKPRVND